MNALLLPAAALLVILFLFFFIALNHLLKISVEESTKERLDFYQIEFRKSFEEQSLSLVSLLGLLSNIDGVKSALSDLDRDQLNSILSETYSSLRATQGITHFYFHDVNRVNIIRLHELTRYGDEINRKTTIDAAMNNAVTFGFELGILGTFTVRAVSPVYQGNELLGYIEIGKEIEDIARHISVDYDLGWTVLIHKKLLIESEWIQGMKLLGRNSNWDLFEDAVLVSSSDAEIPKQLDSAMTQKIISAQSEAIFSGIDDSYKVGVIDLFDVSGREVGKLALFIEQSELLQDKRERDLLYGFFLISILILILLGIWRVLRKADERINEEKAKLAFQAYHDSLTGLSNRKRLYDRLEHAIELAKRSKRKLAILFLDLDNFKSINDSLGHDAGDELLVSVAQVLLNSIRSEDTLARNSGDEFIILMEEVDDLENCVKLAEKITAIFKSPFSLLEKTVHVTMSIGIAVYPDDAKEPDTLIINADRAMYHAKNLGKNRFQLYNEEQAEYIVRRIAIEQILKNALTHNRFSLVFQPQQDLSADSVSGIEALIRLNDPEFGAVSPAEFIPIAESCGLISQIGSWVMKEAISTASKWHKLGYNFGRIAINVSAKQLNDPGFESEVVNYLRSENLPAEKLELEVTESVFLSNVDLVVSMLKSLKSKGISIAVDDFGMGYSSLSKIRSLPITNLKIDKSFIDSISSNNDDQMIIMTILALAKNLELATIAEGVEFKEQREFLIEQGCQNIQGYLFSKPLSSSALQKFLDKYQLVH